jgi:heme exporter protein B
MTTLPSVDTDGGAVTPATGPATHRWLSQAAALLGKDLRSELRSAAASTAIGMFALVTLIIVSYGIQSTPLEPQVQASLLWTVLFFASSVGLARTFVKEEETKTAIALRMTAQPSVVFGGKLAFNFLLMLGLVLILVPLFLVFMSVRIASPAILVAVLAVGVAGLSGGSTIVAAIIAKARVRGPLFGALAFPVLIPLLLLLVRATTLAIEGTAWGEVSSYLWGLTGFTGAMITASFLLFDAVWES